MHFLYSLVIFFLLTLLAPCDYCISYTIIRDAEIESFLKNISTEIINKVDYYSEDRIKNGDFKYPVYNQNSFGIRQFAKLNAIQQSREKPIVRFDKYSYLNTVKTRNRNLNLSFYFIDSSEINAFVSNGINLYVFAGLIAAYDNSDLLYGVLSHEIGHVVNMHSFRSSIDFENAKMNGLSSGGMVTLLSIMSPVSGIAGAIAGLAIGSQVGNGSALQYSRIYEQEADNFALHCLEKNQKSSDGLIDLMEYFSSKMGDITNFEKYFYTHPIPSERLEKIRRYKRYEDKLSQFINKKREIEFQRVKNKIIGFYDDKFTKIETNKSKIPFEMEKYSDFFSNYRKLFFDFKSGNFNEVVKNGEELLLTSRNDIYITEIIGQSYCALRNFKKAKYYYDLIKDVNNFVIDFEFGECFIKSDNKNDIEMGILILNKLRLLNKNDINSRGILVKIYEKIEKIPYSLLNKAEISLINGNLTEAKFIANKAKDLIQNDGSDIDLIFQLNDIINLN